MIGDVCGVGERIGTGICKGFSAIRGTSCSWAINVVATVPGSACDLVRRLAEAVDVDTAMWVAALESRLFPRTHNGCHGDHEREIEPVLQASNIDSNFRSEFAEESEEKLVPSLTDRCVHVCCEFSGKTAKS